MARKRKYPNKVEVDDTRFPGTMSLASDGFSNSAFLLMPSTTGYQAAGHSQARGYLYWPHLSTRMQVDKLTREEIARRVQWLYAHFGFARRLVNGIARLLGYLTPQPNTTDEDWNELAFDVFMGIASSAEIYDIRGRFDFFQSQIQDTIATIKDGDGLQVFTESPSGFARVATYEAHQLSNGDKTSSDWVDGVQLSKHGKHLAYGLRDDGDKTHVVVDARDCVYFGGFENRGQIRPLSVLHAAVINMVDVVETRGFVKHAIKAHSRIGTVIEQDVVQVAQNPAGGMGAAVFHGNQTMPDGSTQPVNMEMVYSGGMTPNMKPGQRVKVVADNRPSPNSMEFEKALLRDCMYACDLSYEALCDVSGITGPGIRFLNSELKQWIALRRYTLAKRVNRFYVYALAKEMKAGRLRMPELKEGERWWQSTVWIGQAALDIDAGRTAATTLIDLQSGQTTWMEEWGKKGMYWKRGIRQSVAEVIFAKRICIEATEQTGIAVTAAEVFPQRFGINNVQVMQEAEEIKLSEDSDMPDALPAEQ